MITVYFGSPGAGKTTTAVREFKRMYREGRYDYYFANFDVNLPYVRKCDLKGLGAWTFPPNSFICIDEAGIEYNNRKFKSLPQNTIEWFKLVRHYGCDLSIWSQDYQDMDITLRRLANQYWHIKKIGPFTLAREIRKFVHIDKEKHDIVDGYEFRSAWLRLLPFPFHRKTWYLVFRPFHYKNFDSYARPNTRVEYWGAPTPIRRQKGLAFIGKSALTGLLKREVRFAHSVPPSDASSIGDQTTVLERGDHDAQ